MGTDGFYRHYGADGRDDRLVRLGGGGCVLLYGYGVDAMGGYRWRRDYAAAPSSAELRADVCALVNGLTDAAIREGMEYEGQPVWLSVENQLTFGSAVAPVRLKLGELAGGAGAYRVFGTEAELAAFRAAVARHIAGCLERGWLEKDALDAAALAGEAGTMTE